MRLVRITASSWAPGDGYLGQPPRPAEKWHKKSTTKKNRQILGRANLFASSAELLRVKRHKFPDAHRRPAGHPLDAVRLPVITTRPVQLAHRQKMHRQMLRHTLPFQLLFPLLGADVRVRDLSVQRVREFAGDPIHVLGLRTGEFVDQAKVRHRVGENGSDYLSDISRCNRTGLAPPERQFDSVSVADARSG